MAQQPAFVSGDRESACAAGAKFLGEAIQERAASGGKIVVALCGGTSPDPLYPELVKLLPGLPDSVRERMVFTLTDERRVPLDHQESNWRRMQQGLFIPLVGQGVLSAENFLVFPADQDDPARACALYNEALGRHGGELHIVVIAPGEDGHVAACWPGHDASLSTFSGFVHEAERPKPPAEGFTATLTLLRRASHCLALFFGAGKAEIFKSYRSKDVRPQELPIQIARTIERRFICTDLEVPQEEQGLL